jgi:hypothetical protein
VIGHADVGLHGEIREQDPEEQIGAQARVDQARVLADPAKARIGGEDPFLDGPCVDIGAGRNRSASQRLEAGLDSPQAVDQHVVVVVPARVA